MEAQPEDGQNQTATTLYDALTHILLRTSQLQTEQQISKTYSS